MKSAHLVTKALRHPVWAYNAIRMRGRISAFTQTPRRYLEQWLRELHRRDDLPALLADRWKAETGEPLWKYSGGSTIGPSNEGLYLLVRCATPDVVIETGVASGFSTAFILQALADNHRGNLISIDLPNTRPEGYLNEDHIVERVHVPSADKVGQVIPQHLRSRWRLVIGSSQDHLPSVIAAADRVDFFFHDSSHAYQNMMFEFQTVWPRLSPGGILASDDIAWNSAFADFSRNVSRTPVFWVGRGAMRK